MTNSSFLIWNSACVSDAGKIREVNQDAFLNLPELGMWVVADGMGGHKAGEVASGSIIEHCQQTNEPVDLNSFIAEVQTRLLQVNQSLRQMAIQKYNNATIGSTVVVLLAYGKQCAYLWVGDSRIYRLRNSKLEQMTRDHSMVEQYIEQGIMSVEEAHNSNVTNVLTRAVGGEDEMEIDLKVDEMQADDIFLLCSDGLYREVSEADMTQLMSRGDDCSTMTKNLLESALNNGARDNVTVSVIQIKDAYT
jgi:serine/threonine protein phosphatase PrpC